MLNLQVFAVVLASVSLNAFAQIALRKTVLTVGTPGAAGSILHYLLMLAVNPWFIIGLSCYVISMGLWMLVLSKLEVSLAYPLLSIGYIIAAIIGYYYLGESIGVHRIVGIALICVGIVVLSRGA